MTEYQKLLDQRSDTPGTEIGPLQIVQYPAPVLREVTKEITNFDDKLAKTAQDMIETMYSAQGVGLAAPQVSLSIQLLVMDPLQDDDSEAVAIINPRITRYAGYSKSEEGCLSILDYRADVERATEIEIEYQDITGKQHKDTFYDFPAIVLQHEIDHLNGILFVDRIGKLKRSDFLRKFGLEKNRKYTRPASLATLP